MVDSIYQPGTISRGLNAGNNMYISRTNRQRLRHDEAQSAIEHYAKSARAYKAALDEIMAKKGNWQETKQNGEPLQGPWSMNEEKMSLDWAASYMEMLDKYRFAIEQQHGIAVPPAYGEFEQFRQMYTSMTPGSAKQVSDYNTALENDLKTKPDIQTVWDPVKRQYVPADLAAREASGAYQQGQIPLTTGFQQAAAAAGLDPNSQEYQELAMQAAKAEAGGGADGLKSTLDMLLLQGRIQQQQVDLLMDTMTLRDKQYAHEKEVEQHAQQTAQNLATARTNQELSLGAIKNVDDALAAIGPWSTGVSSWFTRYLTPEGRLLRTELNSINAYLGFDALQKARQGSSTGASGYGNLTEKELSRLEGLRDTLEQDLTGKDLARKLLEIKHTWQRIWLYENYANGLEPGLGIEPYSDGVIEMQLQGANLDAIIQAAQQDKEAGGTRFSTVTNPKYDSAQREMDAFIREKSKTQDLPTISSPGTSGDGSLTIEKGMGSEAPPSKLPNGEPNPEWDIWWQDYQKKHGITQ